MVRCLIIKVLAGLIILSNITKPTKHQEHQSKTEQCLQFIFTQFQIFTLFEVKSKYLKKVNLHLLLPKYIHEVLTKCITKSIKTGSFPDSLRKANIAPILKKSDSVEKCKYRPTSILSLVLKHYEMLTYNQLSKHEMHLSHYYKLGKKSQIMEVLQAHFVWICLKLMIAYHRVTSTSTQTTLLIDYPTNRKQRTKIGFSSSLWYPCSSSF